MKILRIIFLLFWILYSSYSEDSLTVTVGGDVMLARGIQSRIKKIGSDNFFKFYKKYFEKSDFGIINLEGPACKTKKKIFKKYNFRNEPEILQNLKQIGITHLGLANNHSIDYGSCGLMETVEFAKKYGLEILGYGKSKKDAENPVIIEKNGIKVALFSSVILKLPYYHRDSCYDNYINKQTATDLSDNISEYKRKNPDTFIMVILHWGWEDTYKPRESQVNEAGSIIKSGADIIIGTHPHVIQKILRIEGKPVYFSIGNLIFDGKNKEGLILKLTFYKNKKLDIKEIKIK